MPTTTIPVRTVHLAKTKELVGYVESLPNGKFRPLDPDLLPFPAYPQPVDCDTVDEAARYAADRTKIRRALCS